ncbi:MAG: DUF1990 family protein [Segniliparus sp.]|uniref:DUF1990 family protein n=1 Tax=Segniliparus sp. TaxID=2804064 RepID=UPI003F358829
MSFTGRAFRGKRTPLPQDEARLLRTAPFSYPAAGVTRGEADKPRFFLPLAGAKTIGTGEARFYRAATAVLTWQAQLRAGLGVRTSSSFISENDVVDQRLGPLSLPCRVVYVVDEPRRKGFAYGTLPGHLERGEERFVVSWDQRTDEVRVEVSSVSLPVWPLLPVLPAVRAVQRFYVRRFLAVIEEASR